MGISDRILTAWWERLEARALLSAGDLDLSFGSGGLVRLSITNSDDGATRVAVQPDAKILFAGPAGSIPGVAAVARLNEDGTPDASFGTAGIVQLPVGTVHGLVIQSDGKILVAGKTPEGSPPSADFAIARLLSSGGLDTSFGVAGYAVTDFHGRADEPSDMTLRSDGRILVTGNAVTLAGHLNFTAASYNADGSPDTSFGGGDGKVSIDFAGESDALFAHAVQGDAKIVLAGYSFRTGRAYGFSFVRLHPDGSFDQTFGVGGKVQHDLIPNNPDQRAEVWDVAVQADDRIVGVGRANGAFFAARFNGDGQLDTSFGTAGMTFVPFSGSDVVTSGFITPDNRIMLSGWGGARDFQLARLRANGTVDSSFGVNGKVSTDFEFSNDDSTASTIVGDRIIAVGSTSGTNGSDFAAARYDAGTAAPVPPPIASADFRYQTAPHRVLINFTSNVGSSLSLADLSLVNLTTGTTPAPGSMSLAYESATNVATLTFPGLPNQILSDGRYRLTLSASGISDINGFRLDGNGDGIPGDDYVHNFAFLTGDANHDGRVNLNDFNILAANFGQGPRDFTQGDFNYDGIVNLDDFNLLAARFGVVLAGPGAGTGPDPRPRGR
jgi:uncharacterized delta-60 repeat protein